MTNIQPPPTLFHCVFFFDPVGEEFQLHAVYSKPEDAQACKDLLPKGMQGVTVSEWTMSAIQAHLLQQAIEQATRLQRAGLIQQGPDKSTQPVPAPQAPAHEQQPSTAPLWPDSAALAHMPVWPMRGVRVDGDSVVVSMGGPVPERTIEARRMCGDLIALIESRKVKPSATIDHIRWPITGDVDAMLDNIANAQGAHHG